MPFFESLCFLVVSGTCRCILCVGFTQILFKVAWVLFVPIVFAQEHGPYASDYHFGCDPNGYASTNTWDQAQARCKIGVGPNNDRGGPGWDLASFPTINSLNTLFGQVGVRNNAQTWLGAKDAEVEGSWRFVFGRLAGVEFFSGTYGNGAGCVMSNYVFPSYGRVPWTSAATGHCTWGVNEPNNGVTPEYGNQNCQVATSALPLDDLGCTYPVGCYFCERTFCRVGTDCYQPNTVEMTGTYFPNCVCRCRLGAWGVKCQYPVTHSIGGAYNSEFFSVCQNSTATMYTASTGRDLCKSHGSEWDLAVFPSLASLEAYAWHVKVGAKLQTSYVGASDVAFEGEWRFTAGRMNHTLFWVGGASGSCRSYTLPTFRATQVTWSGCGLWLGGQYPQPDNSRNDDCGALHPTDKGDTLLMSDTPCGVDSGYNEPCVVCERSPCQLDVDCRAAYTVSMSPDWYPNCKCTCIKAATGAKCQRLKTATHELTVTPTVTHSLQATPSLVVFTRTVFTQTRTLLLSGSRSLALTRSKGTASLTASRSVSGPSPTASESKPLTVSASLTYSHSTTRSLTASATQTNSIALSGRSPSVSDSGKGPTASPTLTVSSLLPLTLTTVASQTASISGSNPSISGSHSGLGRTASLTLSKTTSTSHSFSDLITDSSPLAVTISVSSTLSPLFTLTAPLPMSISHHATASVVVFGTSLTHLQSDSLPLTLTRTQSLSKGTESLGPTRSPSASVVLTPSANNDRRDDVNTTRTNTVLTTTISAPQPIPDFTHFTSSVPSPFDEPTRTVVPEHGNASLPYPPPTVVNELDANGSLSQALFVAAGAAPIMTTTLLHARRCALLEHLTIVEYALAGPIIGANANDATSSDDEAGPKHGGASENDDGDLFSPRSFASALVLNGLAVLVTAALGLATVALRHVWSTAFRLVFRRKSAVADDGPSIGSAMATVRFPATVIQMLLFISHNSAIVAGVMIGRAVSSNGSSGSYYSGNDEDLNPAATVAVFILILSPIVWLSAVQLVFCLRPQQPRFAVTSVDGWCPSTLLASSSSSLASRRRDEDSSSGRPPFVPLPGRSSFLVCGAVRPSQTAKQLGPIMGDLRFHRSSSNRMSLGTYGGMKSDDDEHGAILLLAEPDGTRPFTKFNDGAIRYISWTPQSQELSGSERPWSLSCLLSPLFPSLLPLALIIASLVATVAAAENTSQGEFAYQRGGDCESFVLLAVGIVYLLYALAVGVFRPFLAVSHNAVEFVCALCSSGCLIAAYVLLTVNEGDEGRTAGELVQIPLTILSAVSNSRYPFILARALDVVLPAVVGRVYLPPQYRAPKAAEESFVQLPTDDNDATLLVEMPPLSTSVAAPFSTHVPPLGDSDDEHGSDGSVSVASSSSSSVLSNNTSSTERSSSSSAIDL